jgi:hypothetical protein
MTNRVGSTHSLGTVCVLFGPGFGQPPDLHPVDAQRLRLSNDRRIFAFLDNTQKTAQTEWRMMQLGKGKVCAIVTKYRHLTFFHRTHVPYA